MALYKRRRAKYDENVIKTAPDTRRAQGNAEDDDFEAEPEEITTSLPRKRKRPGSTAVAAKGPAFAFMKLPAEIRNMIYRHVVVSKCSQVELTGRWRSKNFIRGGIRTAILSTNKQIHGEAKAILYTENRFLVQYGDVWDGGGVALRFEDAQTASTTSRSLRSGRTVIMSKHRGLIPESSLHLLRNVRLEVNLPSRQKICNHHALLYAEVATNSLRSLYCDLQERWLGSEHKDVGEHGRSWVLAIVNPENSHLQSLLIKKIIEPLLSYTIQQMVLDELLMLEVVGAMPRKWKTIFEAFEGWDGFLTDKVPEVVAPVKIIPKDMILKMFQGREKYWTELDDCYSSD